jgi:Uma2 family endonuclease
MAPELERKLEYSDLQVTPDDGRRYELVRGELLVSPSPTPTHQRVLKRLHLALVEYFEGRALGEVFFAPVDLILTNHDVFVPDLLVVGDPSSVSGRGIEAPPLLVVEILSPSTRKQDRGLKAQRYRELGVRHYWIVDPDGRRIECLRSEGRAFRTRLEAEGDATIEHPDWPGLIVDLGALWRPR